MFCPFVLFAGIYSFFTAVSCEELKQIDLTWDFDDTSVYWPGNREFVFTRKIENDEVGYWYSANEFCAAEHGGTHLDAPRHFSQEGWTVGEIPLSRLIVKGITIDVSSEVEKFEENATLEVEHIEKWISKYGSIPNNVVILVRFGWSQYYGNKTKYLGVDGKGNLNFPGISEEAAKWIRDSGKVVGVGLDTASLDAGSSKQFPAHRILLGNQIYGLENLKIPEDIPAKDFILYIMPMKIKEGSGAPLRIIAIPLAENNAPNNDKLMSGSDRVFSEFVTIFNSLFIIFVTVFLN